MDTDWVAIHPFESVTVTSYVPAASPVKSSVAAANGEPSFVQEYE